MKYSFFIIAILITLSACIKKNNAATLTATAPPSNTSKIQMVTYSPVFPYFYEYSTANYPVNMQDTAATQNLSVTYTVTNSQNKSYSLSAQEANNLNTTTDSFRVTVYINGAKKYYNAGKHAAQVQFHL